jgi:hypothetical protein
MNVTFEALEPVDDVVVAVEVYDQEGMLIYGSDTSIVDQPFSVPVGTATVRLSFDQVPLLEGGYTLAFSIANRDGIIYDRSPEQHFEVMNPGRSRGSVNLDLSAEVRVGH